MGALLDIYSLFGRTPQQKAQDALLRELEQLRQNTALEIARAENRTSLRNTRLQGRNSRQLEEVRGLQERLRQIEETTQRLRQLQGAQDISNKQRQLLRTEQGQALLNALNLRPDAARALNVPTEGLTKLKLDQLAATIDALGGNVTKDTGLVNWKNTKRLLDAQAQNQIEAGRLANKALEREAFAKGLVKVGDDTLIGPSEDERFTIARPMPIRNDVVIGKPILNEKGEQIATIPEVVQRMDLKQIVPQILGSSKAKSLKERMDELMRSREQQPAPTPAPAPAQTPKVEPAIDKPNEMSSTEPAQQRQEVPATLAALKSRLQDAKIGALDAAINSIMPTESVARKLTNTLVSGLRSKETRPQSTTPEFKPLAPESYVPALPTETQQSQLNVPATLPTEETALQSVLSKINVTPVPYRLSNTPFHNIPLQAIDRLPTYNTPGGISEFTEVTLPNGIRSKIPTSWLITNQTFQAY